MDFGFVPAMASAFLLARRGGTKAGSIAGGKLSSACEGITLNANPISRSSNCLRGELEASIRGCDKFMLEDGTEHETAYNLRIKEC